MSTHAIAVVPPTCPISAAGGKSKHKLINQSALKLAFKIKSSNNSNYGVNPIFGFVNVGAEVEVEITRKAGKPQADKLVVMYKSVADDVVDAKAVFEAKDAKPAELDGEVIVKLSAAE
uniref:MSP domain-containing protein n=1 Tax=Panagrellus redivivus TaxID=6233 RepID=A0A7E4VHN9_PANRE